MVLSTRDSSEFNSLGYSQDIIRKLNFPARRDTGRNMAESEDDVESIIAQSTQILFDVTLDISAIDVILSGSRRMVSRGTSGNTDGASSSNTAYLSTTSTARKSKGLEMLDLPGSGIGLIVNRSCFQLSGEGNHLDILMDICGIESLIFSCQSVEAYAGHMLISQIKKLLEQSSGYVCRFTVSKSMISSHIGSSGVTSSTNVGDTIGRPGSSSYRGLTTHALEACHLLTTRIPEAGSDCLLFVDIQLGRISLSSHCMKRSADARQPNNLDISIYFHKGLDTVNCNIQVHHAFHITTLIYQIGVLWVQFCNAFVFATVCMFALSSCPCPIFVALVFQ